MGIRIIHSLLLTYIFKSKLVFVLYSLPRMSSTAYYPYTPSLIPAVIGVGIYCALFAIHAVRMCRSQAWDGSYMLIAALGKKQLSPIYILSR